jgi:hypothetical protein
MSRFSTTAVVTVVSDLSLPALVWTTSAATAITMIADAAAMLIFLFFVTVIPPAFHF